MKPEKKGSSQIDWIMGFLFFIMIVLIFISYTTYISRTQQPYETPLKSQLIDLSKSVEEQITWTAYRVPLTINSAYTLTNYPLSIEYEINHKTKNSTYILDKTGNILSTEVDMDESKIYWISNIHEGKNTFYLFYITDSELNESANTTKNDFITDNTSIANTHTSTEFDNFSISSLIFNSIEFTDGGILLNTTKKPLIINNTAKTTVTYPKNTTVTVFMNSSHIRVHTNAPDNFILHLNNYLTRFYVDGSTHLFNGSNEYSGITNYADLYNNSGISVIGANMNITITDTGTTRDIYIFNETDFEIYLHTGSYANMLNQSAIYPGPDILIGLPEELSGIREDKISELEDLYYDELSQKLQIDDLGVLVRIENPES